MSAMEKSGNVSVITRSFQAGTGGAGKTFDANSFAEKVATPIRRLLRSSEGVVKRIIVVTNGDPKSPLAENMLSEGVTPTVAALHSTFPKEVADGRLVAHICTDWGRNVGSGNALNDGLKIIEKLGDTQFVLTWSPEMEMTGYMISNALGFMERKKLSVAGFLRKRWWERPQWNVAQNTAALWNLKTILSVKGFSPECNGTGRTIMTPEFGEVLLAGMEDFHAMMKIMLNAGNEFRWGMLGRSEPLEWSVDFPHGSEREKNHLIKVARQYLVMQSYTQMLFPELSFHAVMDRLFAAYYQE